MIDSPTRRAYAFLSSHAPPALLTMSPIEAVLTGIFLGVELTQRHPLIAAGLNEDLLRTGRELGAVGNGKANALTVIAEGLAEALKEEE